MSGCTYPGYTITEGRQTETHDRSIRSREHKRIRLLRHIDAKSEDPNLSGATSSYIVGVRRPGQTARMFSKIAIEMSRQTGWCNLVLFIRLRENGILG